MSLLILFSSTTDVLKLFIVQNIQKFVIFALFCPLPNKPLKIMMIVERFLHTYKNLRIKDSI